MIETTEHLPKQEANLFSILSHELKSSITLISGLSELLKNNPIVCQDKELNELIGYINTTSDHTQRLLENIFNWSFLQNGRINFQPQDINIRELIKAEIAYFEVQVSQKKLHVNANIANEIIFADKYLLGMIIRNLLSNAIKFSYRGGSITIYLFAYFDYYEFSVSDEGKGMDQSTKNRLFRKEVQVSLPGTESEKGTGLGLLLCKEFVAQHHGKIWVDSEIELGSQFKFIIPNGGISI